MALTVYDVVPYFEVGQYWAFLNPLRLARIDTVGGGMVQLKTWTPHGVDDEIWVMPIDREKIRHLWRISLIKIDHFGEIPPNTGSVWAFTGDSNLFFVGDRSTEHPDKIWVFTDWDLNIDDETSMIWLTLRQIQRGPGPLVQINLEPTALDQILEEED